MIGSTIGPRAPLDPAHPPSARAHRAALVAVATLALSCAGPPPAEVVGAPAAPGPPSAHPIAPKLPAAELASRPVYDASGKPQVCSPPKLDCPAAAPDRAFLDRCRLSGFLVRRCGCADLCSGDAVAASRHYDAAGNAQECAPAQPDCTPPRAPAAFQDACAERGHRLDVCGCAWLCSGNPTK